MFDLYLALGDSMSIDFYPLQSAEGAGLRPRADIGAASLLFQNEDNLFPEFGGNDLLSKYPGIAHTNLAVDGAIAEDVLSPEHLKYLSECSDRRSLITLTLGGNDLLSAFRRSAGRDIGELFSLYQQVLVNYTKVVAELTKLLPKSTVVLTSVFDPTDGTGTMPTKSALYSGNFPIEFLIKFNDHVRETAKSNSLLFADVHAHFSGHGAAADTKDNFWYWTGSPIEPSFIGASEIRRVWLSTIEKLP